MNIATIGTSRITERFVKASFASGWNYTRTYSRDITNARIFAETHGAKSFCSNLSELASDDIDLVYIASPNTFHFEQTRYFLEAGKHVVCEKPMVLSSAEFEVLAGLSREVSKRYGREIYLFEAFRHINSKGFAALRENLPKIGAIRSVNISYNQYSSRYDEFKSGKCLANSFNPEFGGGVLNDLGVYLISFAAALWGMPLECMYMPFTLDNGSDGTGSVLLRYNGFICNAVFSKIVESKAENEISGEMGSLLFDRASELEKIKLYTRESDSLELVYDQMMIGKLFDEVAVFDGIMKTNDRAEYERLLEISRITIKVIEQCAKQVIKQ